MQRVARRAIESADIVLCCALAPPWSRMTALSTGDPPALLRILTKADLHPEACCPMGVLRTSAVTGAGLDQLRRRIAERVLERRTARGAELLPISRRAQEALRVAVESLEQAAGLAESGPSERALDAPELVAAALRRALDALGSVSGRVTSDDVLGLVFSRFCIGK
jgi:tRNA modification GTPase